MTHLVVFVSREHKITFSERKSDFMKKNNTQALASQSALYASATDQHLITVAGFRSQQSEAENEIIKINSLPCFDVTFCETTGEHCVEELFASWPTFSQESNQISSLIVGECC